MATFPEGQWIWRDGEFVAWKDATLHLLSTAVQFGSSIFEGIRCYPTPDGPAIFRLREHMRRLRDSCATYRMVPEWSQDELVEAAVETARRNDLESGYVRPMVLRGYGAPGLDPRGSPVETWIAAWPWGTYLGDDALERGVDVTVSSWWRAQPNTFPMTSKAAGHYNSALLMKLEAQADGYDDAIAVGTGGLVSEGSGMNVFLVRDGRLITPFLDGSSLVGITRDAVITLAREDLGLEVLETFVPREALYSADEVFYTGTATEITPIRSVDRIQVGEGRMGPVTRQVQKRFWAIARGEAEDTRGWLTRVA